MVTFIEEMHSTLSCRDSVLIMQTGKEVAVDDHTCDILKLSGYKGRCNVNALYAYDMAATVNIHIVCLQHDCNHVYLVPFMQHHNDNYRLEAGLQILFHYLRKRRQNTCNLD